MIRSQEALPLALLARVGRFLRQLSTCIVSSPKEKKEEAAKQGGWGGEATHTLASWSYPSSMVWKFPRSFFSFFWIKEQLSLIHPFSLSLSLSLFLFLSLSLSLSLSFASTMHGRKREPKEVKYSEKRVEAKKKKAKL